MTNPPTICHVNLARGFRGGERQTELLVRRLQAGGWPQRLVARRGQPLAERLCGLPDTEVVECGAGVIECARAVGRTALIHVHEGRSLRGAWINSRLTGTPYLVTRRIQRGPRDHWLNRRMYRQAARVVVLSRAIRGSLESFDPSLALTVIPSATAGLRRDPEHAAALRAGWGGDFVVGHVAALDDSHKGQKQIIAVARALAGAERDIRFVLVGGGRDEAMLRSAAGGESRIVFTGQVAEVGDYLAAFDAFLFPSRHEGLGSILLDALDFGLPVVATRVGGIPEVIQDGVNGLLFEVDDVAGMRDALESLAADEDLRSRLAAAGRKTARSFSAETMAERYACVYRAVLADRETETA